MANIKEAARLICSGLSCREVSKRTGISKTTVSEIAKNLPEEIRKAPEKISEIEDEEFKQLVRPSKQNYREKLNFEEISERLKTKHVTLQIIYEGLYSRGIGRPYSYSHFCHLYRDWEKQKRRQAQYTNLEHNPGESMEIDFAGDKFYWIDKNGQYHEFKLFIATMSYSQMTYVRACENEKRKSWLEGINGAYFYFGGVAQNLVCDNAKALVSKNDGIEVRYAAELESIAQYFGAELDACDVYSPRQKNRVESAVNSTYKQIMGRLLLKDKELHMDSLLQLNQEIERCCDEFNARRFTNKAGSRQELFAQEKQYLRELPTYAYAFVEWKKLTVDNGHCIKIHPEGHRYSVPQSYIGKSVLAQLSDTEIRIIDMESSEEIAFHHRCKDSLTKTHMLPEHLTENEKYMRRNRPEYTEILLRNGLSNELTEQLLERIYTTVHSSLGVRRKLESLLRLYRLSEIELPLRAHSVNEAIAECLSKNQLEVRLIRLIALKIAHELRQEKQGNRLDSNYRTPNHENIRNNYYH